MTAMKLYRTRKGWWLGEEGHLVPSVSDLDQMLSAEDLQFAAIADDTVTQFPTSRDFLAPIQAQEVWAAGVTYLRSKKARMEESDFSASAYDKVYEAARPELFFKSLPEKVVSPGEPVGIRRDGRWNVPEP